MTNNNIITAAIANLEILLKKYEDGHIMVDAQAEVDHFNEVRNELSYDEIPDDIAQQLDGLYFKVKDCIVRLMEKIGVVIQEYTEDDLNNTLDGLNERVVIVCELLKALPVVDARKLVPQIEAMYSIVTQVSESISVKQKNIEEELQSLKNTSKANQSYKSFKDD